MGEYIQVMTTTETQTHPYDVPEILAVPVVTGSQSYLEWLSDALNVDSQ